MAEQSMRDRLVEALNRPTHAPMETHSQLDGSCTECPWPTYALPPEGIADAILPLIEEAVTAERERCAGVAESNLGRRWVARETVGDIAAAIRGDREPEPATEEGSNRDE